MLYVADNKKKQESCFRNKQLIIQHSYSFDSTLTALTALVEFWQSRVTADQHRETPTSKYSLNNLSAFITFDLCRDERSLSVI